MATNIICRVNNAVGTGQYIVAHRTDLTLWYNTLDFYGNMTGIWTALPYPPGGRTVVSLQDFSYPGASCYSTLIFTAVASDNTVWAWESTNPSAWIQVTNLP
jgi:hypothetical protein